MILRVLEHENIRVTDECDAEVQAISRAQADALRRLQPRLPPGVFTWGHNSLKFSQYCGVITLGDLTLEILPKIHGLEEEPGATRQMLVRMLHGAGMLQPAISGQGELALQKHSLLDVFVIHFCQQLRRELLQGMIRTYVQLQENLAVLKGRLRTELQFRHNLHRPDRLYCQYDEHSEDNRFNQLIKFSLRILSDTSLGTSARQQVEELLLRFGHVAERAFTLSESESLQLDRLNQRYMPILEQCRRIIAGHHPDITVGGFPGLTLLFDMNRLFEAWVASRMRKWAWKKGMRMRTQGPRRYLARSLDEDQPIFMMMPDMSFLDEENRILMIGDTKWKLLDDSERKLGISQSDMYQMFSYANGCTQLTLIYPRQSGLLEPLELVFSDSEVKLRIFPWDLAGNKLLNLDQLFNDFGFPESL